MAQDNIGEVAGDIIRNEMGVRDDERKASSLRPITKLDDGDFRRGSLGFLFGGGGERGKPLESSVLDRGKLTVEVYREILGKQGEILDKPDYGDHAKIVGQISVSGTGPEGRYLVNFTTTNVNGEDDWRASVNTMLFDEASKDLDRSYPAREDNWIYGEKDGKLSLIGNYKEQFERSGGKIAGTLAQEGWKNLGEVWAADIDRFGGFITPPEK